jgi:integrase
VEQGEVDRLEASAENQGRLVDPDKASGGEAHRDLAMFNLAIDSKLRGCDVVNLRVEEKLDIPSHFELSEQTREAVDEYIRSAPRRAGEFLFPSRRHADRCLTTRQYSRLVSAWIAGIDLDPALRGPHSFRRTKATLVYRRAGNLRAVQLLLGHRPIESSVLYLGVEIDDALALAEQVEIRGTRAERTHSPHLLSAESCTKGEVLAQSGAGCPRTAPDR